MRLMRTGQQVGQFLLLSFRPIDARGSPPWDTVNRYDHEIRVISVPRLPW